MKTTACFFVISVLLAGCNFSKSVKKDLVSGLASTGDGISCTDVYLTVNNVKTENTSFGYGEMVYMIFDDVKGLKTVNGNVFPLMEIAVTNPAGDTLLFADSLYSEYIGGMNYTPLQLTADLTVASPIRSGGEYLLNVIITDRNGPGKYISKLKFSVQKNERIDVEAINVTYNEVYLYSQGNNKVINDNKIAFDDNTYIMVEGLKGFKEENGIVFPGLSVKLLDSEKNTLLDNEDLFEDYSETGVSSSDFASRVSAHFTLNDTEFSNPLHCEILIWDKKSDSKLKISTNLKAEKN